MLNIVNVELCKQLKFHLLSHAVMMCFTYTVDSDDPQAGAGNIGLRMSVSNPMFYRTCHKVIVITVYVKHSVTLCGGKCNFNCLYII